MDIKDMSRVDLLGEVRRLKALNKGAGHMISRLTRRLEIAETGSWRIQYLALQQQLKDLEEKWASLRDAKKS